MKESLDPGAIDGDEEPKRQLSVPRVTVAVVLLLALVGAGFVAVERSTRAADDPVPGTTWFAPYVDTTLTPPSQFQVLESNPARQSALGFVVADPKETCTPSWGGAYGLDEAETSLNLDRRVAQYRNQGGEVVVSFGGAANSELAHACTDIAKLTAAYESVITRYEQTTVDFDIEGDSLADTGATQRRATALVAAQKTARAAGKPFAVWLTLPVAKSGLTSEALAVVTTTLAAGVDVAGVNPMAMNFGSAEKDMGDAVHDSLTATHEQLTRTYSKYGLGSRTTEVWNRMGATVMIGQNDTDGEIFTIDDANELVTEAEGWGLGRLSMWSLSRDAQCGGSYAVVGVHSNTCSGTEQTGLGFSQVFVKLSGSVPPVGDDASPAATPTPTLVPDDPATSPYPLWQANRPYETGYKVVRDGNVYQAKWYSRGQDPAAPSSDPSQNPWQIVGPVLPGESPAPLPTVAPGTYPKWSPSATYEAGNRVLYNQLPYEAKWYNTATSPGAQDADPSASPWKPLFTIPGEPTSGTS